MKRTFPNQTVTITELDEQGYGIGKISPKVEPILNPTPAQQTAEQNNLKNRYFILNALPGETVEAEIHNIKRKDIFGNAVTISNQSKNRLEPRENHFTSCSPWQILNYDEQYNTKKDLLEKAFKNYDIKLNNLKFEACGEENRWNYRNKVEYSFYTDKATEETSLSFFKRGSHFGKIPVQSCCLIHKNLDIAAAKILNWVNSKKLGGFQLKTVLLRSNLQGQVMATLFIKDETVEINSAEILPLIDSILIGLKVAFSSPLSPASIVTKELASAGKTTLVEKLLNLNFEFGIDNFFQINIAEFEKTMTTLKNEIKQVTETYFKGKMPLVASDLYSGVGTIGLSVIDLFSKVKMVEISLKSKELTILNAKNNGLDVSKLEIWEGATEKTLEAIGDEDVVIIDPPRSGLQGKVVDKLLETLPEIIVYLSCNPFTQARDVSLLLTNYEIISQQGFDLYPQTPHLENLLILKKFKSGSSLDA